MNQNSPVPMPSERREYFRVYDAIALQIEPIEVDALDAALDEFDRDRQFFSGSSKKALSMGNANDVLGRFRQDYPDVAGYLESLEMRLELLTSQVNGRDGEMGPYPTHKVNISGNGINFGAENMLVEGQYVALKLQLFPSLSRILVIAQTVSIDKADRNSLTGRFSTGARFVRIDDSDRELLLRHIHNIQIKSLQSRVHSAAET